MAFALLVGLALLTGIVLNQVARHQRLAVLDRLDALGIQPYTPPEPPEDDTQNGMPYLEAAFALSGAVTPYDEDLPSIGMHYNLEPLQQLPEPMIEALRQTRGLREQLAQWVDEAGRRTILEPKWSADPTSWDSKSPMLAGTRRVARRLEGAMVLAMHEGRPEEVVATVRRFDTIIRSLRGGVLIHQLVEMSIKSLAAGMIEDALSRGELPAEHLEALGGIFADWYDATDLEAGLRGELRFVREMISPSTDPPMMMPFGPPRKRGLGVLFSDLQGWPYTWMAGGSVAAYEDFLRVRDRREDVVAWSQVEEADSGIFSSITAPAYGASVQTAIRSQDRLQVAMAALRVEAFRVGHGRWPEMLSEVAEGEAFTDWAGRPLVYRVVEGDAWVYGVGMNGKDDGGQSWWYFDGDDVSKEADDDSQFRLYAPGKRGSLPPPERIEYEDDGWGMEDMGTDSTDADTE